MTKQIQAAEIQIGEGTFIHPSAVIRGVNGEAKRIVLGDHCYIGEQVQIICDDFSLGDYSKIQHHTTVHGYLPCHIGHNAWIGQHCIIDSIGGMNIGNNCGIGAHSQLWSHIKFGDTLEGCRFLSEKAAHIGHDVWFVGHCIVSPITAEDKSMAMAGSVITKDMAYNQIYAGSPALSVSDKLGFQFQEVSIEQKMKVMNGYLEAWNPNHEHIVLLEHFEGQDLTDERITFFNLSKRTYTKRGTAEEVSLMKFLLPEKAKFIPHQF